MPGCTGCGEGSVSVSEHRQNLCHSHGGQVKHQTLAHLQQIHGTQGQKNSVFPMQRSQWKWLLDFLMTAKSLKSPHGDKEQQ